MPRARPDEQGGPADEATNNLLLWEAFSQLVFGLSMLGCPPGDMIALIEQAADVLPDALDGEGE